MEPRSSEWYSTVPCILAVRTSYAAIEAACQQAPKRLGSLSASSFLTSSLPGGICDFTQPARDGGHRMKGTRPSISAKGTCII